MPTCKIKEINIPDYGTFHIRRFSAAMKSRLDSVMADTNLTDEQKNTEAAIVGVLFGLVDEHGKRVYDDSRIDEIRDMDMSLLNAIGAAILELQGANPASIEAAIKNSSPSPSGSSASA